MAETLSQAAQGAIPLTEHMYTKKGVDNLLLKTKAEAVELAIQNLDRRLAALTPIEARAPNTVNEMRTKQGMIALTLNQLIGNH